MTHHTCHLGCFSFVLTFAFQILTFCCGAQGDFTRPHLGLSHVTQHCHLSADVTMSGKSFKALLTPPSFCSKIGNICTPQNTFVVRWLLFSSPLSFVNGALWKYFHFSSTLPLFKRSFFKFHCCLTPLTVLVPTIYSVTLLKQSGTLLSSPPTRRIFCAGFAAIS